MNPLFVAAAAVQELCRERDWGFCFIGGLAVLWWGEPRLTRDIDLTILAGFGAEGAVVDGLLERAQETNEHRSAVRTHQRRDPLWPSS